jgi:hypothetical protein
VVWRRTVEESDMPKIQLKIVATFKEHIDTKDYVDDFREYAELDDDAEIDQEELRKFAIDQYGEQIAEGDVSLDGLTCQDVDVQEKV